MNKRLVSKKLIRIAKNLMAAEEDPSEAVKQFIEENKKLADKYSYNGMKKYCAVSINTNFDKKTGLIPFEVNTSGKSWNKKDYEGFLKDLQEAVSLADRLNADFQKRFSKLSKEDQNYLMNISTWGWF